MAHDPSRRGSAIPRGVWALGLVSLFMDLSSELIHSILPLYLAIGLLCLKRKFTFSLQQCEKFVHVFRTSAEIHGIYAKPCPPLHLSSRNPESTAPFHPAGDLRMKLV